MSNDTPRERLERAQEAEERNDLEQARELYQAIINDSPYSEAAREAGERMRILDETNEEREEGSPYASTSRHVEASADHTKVVVTDIRLGFWGWFRVLVMITLASIPIQLVLFALWMLVWAASHKPTWM